MNSTRTMLFVAIFFSTAVNAAGRNIGAVEDKTVYDVISTVPTYRMQPPTMQERFEGCILGAAVGDALGRVTEFIKSTKNIFVKYPNGVHTYDDFVALDWQSLYPSIRDKKIAPYTDDTAMAVLVLDALIPARLNNANIENTMTDIAVRFVEDARAKDANGNAIGWMAGFRAPGVTVQHYVHELEKKINSKQTKMDNWWKISPANGKTGGCGSVMRAHPFGLAFVDDPVKAAKWAAQHSYLTHGDTIAVASCAIFANAVAQILNDADVDTVMNSAVSYAQIFNSAQTANKIKKAKEYARRARSLLEQEAMGAFGVKAAFNALHEEVFKEFPGWAADDAIAGALYIYALFPKNLMAGIYLGVHTPGDSDSVASMAGALIGAGVGIGQIQPTSLLERLENYELLKTKANDLYEAVFWKGLADQKNTATDAAAAG